MTSSVLKLKINTVICSHQMHQQVAERMKVVIDIQDSSEEDLSWFKMWYVSISFNP